MSDKHPHSGLPASRRRRFIPGAVLALMVIMISTQIAGFLLTTRQQTQALEIRNGTRDMRIAQQAAVDADASVQTFLLTGDAAALLPYYEARTLLDGKKDSGSGQAAGTSRILEQLALLEAQWEQSIVRGRRDALSRAEVANAGARAQVHLRAVRDRVDEFLATQNGHSAELLKKLDRSRAWVLALQILGGSLTLVGLAFAFRSSAAEARGRTLAVEAAVAAREQVESLFQMADLLQSASGYGDANAVLSTTAQRLLPQFGGTLYVFNNSRDRLDRIAVWNHPEPEALPEFVSPSSCWALKRGKSHLNCVDATSLRCDHYSGTRAVLEMPMMARGELYGLLSFSRTGPAAALELDESRSLAAALADAMSLALANIALREKLRNQALKDQLTGLYNRRYMEDMLERLAGLAERTGRPLSVIMVDLDHFKALNDEHGHAAGDSALRRSAEALMSVLRETDIACRYGGEELMVLLPDCSLDDAASKAEAIRLRIHASGEMTLPVTASFGVAAIPETSTNANTLLAMADAALYRAKRGGRNCVRVAEAAARPSNFSEVALAAE